MFLLQQNMLKTRQSCRACGSAALTPVISLGDQFLASNFSISTDFPPVQRIIPLQVVRKHAAGKKAKIITSIAMFYDLESPNTFVEDVADVLAEDGLWVLEMSYLPTMLEQSSFDTICHEHLEYYSLTTLERLLTAH